MVNSIIAKSIAYGIRQKSGDDPDTGGDPVADTHRAFAFFVRKMVVYAIVSVQYSNKRYKSYEEAFL